MLDLVIENQQDEILIPSDTVLTMWANQALESSDDMQVSLLVVDEVESQRLNHEYRGKDKPTNVLSFPMEMPEELQDTVDVKILGDLVICAAVVEKEAAEQKKTSDAHWAHMLVHGMLHLQGYDHIDDKDAERMEEKEISLLKQLGFENPYLLHADVRLNQDG